MLHSLFASHHFDVLGGWSAHVGGRGYRCVGRLKSFGCVSVPMGMHIGDVRVVSINRSSRKNSCSSAGSVAMHHGRFS